MTSSSRSTHPFFVPPLIATLLIAAPVGADTLFATAVEPAAPALEAEISASPEVPAPRYPREVIARPLTFPKGLLSVGADAGGNHDFSAMTGSPIAGYGITDKLEVQIPYSFATRDFEARGTVGVDVGYAVLRGAVDGKLEVVARVRSGYDTLATDAMPLQLGVHAQYNITPKLAVISGIPGTQQLRISLAENAAGARPIDLALPIGVGIQASGSIYFQVDTRLAQIDLSDSENILIGKDALPASLTMVWNALPELDVQGAVGTDLKNSPGDALTFLVGARYYAGDL
jgi:hypothetical protein